jgi:serine/threonine protein kinase
LLIQYITITFFSLRVIHEKNFIHRDFHSGNIFLSESDTYQHWQIGDLGLTRHANDISLNNDIYGIISYTAPEILKCDKYSKESDIYSMSMIMWELTTGRKPFDNVENDLNETELILAIIDGKRPEITNDTPECFSSLMKKCWILILKKDLLQKKFMNLFTSGYLEKNILSNLMKLKKED